jgi:plasmid stability protein
MTRLTLDLADDLSARLRTRAAETGHASVEDYVQALLRSEAEAAATDEDFGAPEHLTVDSDEALEARLREADGPATEMTPADWQDVRREVAQRLSGGRNSSLE